MVSPEASTSLVQMILQVTATEWLAKLLLKSTTQYLKHPCEHEYSTPILYLSPATTDKTDAYEITAVNTTH